jgi:hypothetical protein
MHSDLLEGPARMATATRLESPALVHRKVYRRLATRKRLCEKPYAK